MRVIPSHAVEMTSAYLDMRVAAILERRRIRSATLEQKQSLAALIHLCGAAAGDAYAARGFRLAAAQRCGEHDAAAYLARVPRCSGCLLACPAYARVNRTCTLP